MSCVWLRGSDEFNARPPANARKHPLTHIRTHTRIHQQMASMNGMLPPATMVGGVVGPSGATLGGFGGGGTGSGGKYNMIAPPASLMAEHNQLMAENNVDGLGMQVVADAPQVNRHGGNIAVAHSHAYARTRTRTRTHTHKGTHTHTHTHTRTRTHTQTCLHNTRPHSGVDADRVVRGGVAARETARRPRPHRISAQGLLAIQTPARLVKCEVVRGARSAQRRGGRLRC